jgi:hypothetical protein
MADKKISQLTTLAQADVAVTADFLPIVDTSATETKKATPQSVVLGALGATSANVGIGTASPASRLDVTGAFGTSTTAFTIYNSTATSASNIARIDFRVNNSFSGNERVAAVWGINPNAAANNGGALVFGVSANGTSTTPSEVARFDQAGNLGIGATASLTGGSRKALTLNSAAGQLSIVEFGINGTIGGYVYANASQLTLSANGASNTSPMTFETGAAERMRLDSAGSLGLGVTPSAWDVFKAVQVQQGSISSSANAANNTVVGSNAYYNAGWKFVATGARATMYQQETGAHSWHTTGTTTGTAGNAISFTQAMTLDASGNLGVGTTSPSDKIHISGSGSTALRVTGQSRFALFAQDSVGLSVYQDGNAPIYFSTNGTERGRFTASGFFKASNTGTYDGAVTSHEFTSNQNDLTLLVQNKNASLTSNVLWVGADRNTTNNTFYPIRYRNTGAGEDRFLVADSGNVTNTNGSYGTISDAKMKTDIVDAGSQWDDIKAVRFRKFKMKDDPSGLMQLGVVAQELEQTSPGLVDEHADRDAEGNDLGTTTKSVKTSVLLMKAAKALQEAMARIEKLEAEMAALKGA